jgi:hypothetical protein
MARDAGVTIMETQGQMTYFGAPLVRTMFISHLLERGGDLLSMAGEEIRYRFDDEMTEFGLLADFGALIDKPVRVRDAAFLIFFYRQRWLSPEGRTDPHRWYPSNDEYASCCASIRSPSRMWPWSLLKHCATASHVACRFDLNEKELRREIRAVQKNYASILEDAIRSGRSSSYDEVARLVA